jgi:hypothetical protein
MARERAIGYGYIIADGCGTVKLDTLRKTRKDCWSVFLEDKEPRINEKENCREWDFERCLCL